jgi:hypothetical protein
MGANVGCGVRQIMRKEAASEHRQTPLELALVAMHEAGIRATIDERQGSGVTLVNFYRRGETSRHRDTLGRRSPPR